MSSSLIGWSITLFICKYTLDYRLNVCISNLSIFTQPWLISSCKQLSKRCLSSQNICSVADLTCFPFATFAFLHASMNLCEYQVAWIASCTYISSSFWCHISVCTDYWVLYLLNLSDERMLLISHLLICYLVQNL